jgi:hypothetical protein
MAKLVKIPKRIVIGLVSLLLMVAHRSYSLVSPFHSGSPSHASSVRRGWLLRAATPFSRGKGAVNSFYAAELNGSFPYIHFREVAANAISVPLAYEDNTLELTEAADLRAFTLPDFGKTQAAPQDTVGPEDCSDDDDCGGGDDCADDCAS